jgi:hypothetical protein
MAIPFNPPTGIIEQYLARPTGYQIGNQQIQNGLEAFSNYQLQKQQRQLEGYKTIASMFENGGPYLLDRLGGQVAKTAGIDPNTLSGYQSPSTPVTPTNAGGTLNSPSVSLTPNTSPLTSPQQSAQPNPQDPSGLIAHSVNNLGHPDYTGLMQMGKYGKGQLDMSKTIGELDRQPLERQRLQGELDMQPMQRQKLQGEIDMQPLQKARTLQEMHLAETKPIAEEVSKQGDSTTRTAQLRGLFDQLKGAVNESAGGLKAGLGATAYKVTRGAMGNAAGNQIENLGAPLTAALNYELTKRFNEAEAGYLQKSLMPSPYDQPALAQQKLTNLDNMITAIESGNEANVKNVAQALHTGQIPSNPTTTQPGPRPGIQTIPGNHNHQAVNADARTGQSQTPTVTSKQQYDALPSGTTYLSADGRPHRKK